jgi:hypothetical protein
MQLYYLVMYNILEHDKMDVDALARYYNSFISLLLFYASLLLKFHL